MNDLLKTIVCGLVRDPENVSITEKTLDNEDIVVYHIYVSEEEAGRVIGKQGRIIKAIRVIMNAVGVANSVKVIIKVN